MVAISSTAVRLSTAAPLSPSLCLAVPCRSSQAGPPGGGPGMETGLRAQPQRSLPHQDGEDCAFCDRVPEEAEPPSPGSGGRAFDDGSSGRD